MIVATAPRRSVWTVIGADPSVIAGRGRLAMAHGRRPRIGLCTALERARWTVWDREAFLLSRAYVDALQARGRDRADDPARRLGRRAPRRRARRTRRAGAGRRRRHRPGLLRRRAPPEDHQHAPRPRPRRDRPGAAGARARPARAGDLPRDAADERRAAAGRSSSTCPTTSATPTTAARSAPSTTPTTTCGWRPARWPRGPAARPVHATKSHHHQAVDALGEGWWRRAGACSTTSSRRSSCPTHAGRWASSGTRRSTRGRASCAPSPPRRLARRRSRLRLEQQAPRRAERFVDARSWLGASGVRAACPRGRVPGDPSSYGPRRGGDRSWSIASVLALLEQHRAVELARRSGFVR